MKMLAIDLSFKLQKQGGEWLAAARSYLQNHCRGGDENPWGSDCHSVTMTMRQVEELAAQVAAAAIVEYQEKLKREQHVIANGIKSWIDTEI